MRPSGFLFGSLSNVGVSRIRSLQSASTEVGEMTKAKGNAPQGFDGIVAAFSKSIGIRAVKSVEDIGLPVFEHPSASREFVKRKTVAGIKPFREPFRSSGAAHSVKEAPLQCSSGASFTS